MRLQEYIEYLRKVNLLESRSPGQALRYLEECIKGLEQTPEIAAQRPHDQRLLTARVERLRKLAVKSPVVGNPQQIHPSPPKRSNHTSSLVPGPPTPTTSSSLRPPSRPQASPSLVPDLKGSRVLGLTVHYWDERAGPQRLGVFPSSLRLGMKDFMQVYANHQADREPGMLSMGANKQTLTSYYSGAPHEIFIILLSKEGDDPDKYEAKLKSMCEQIIQRDHDNKLSESEMHEFFVELQKIGKE